MASVVAVTMGVVTVMINVVMVITSVAAMFLPGTPARRARQAARLYISSPLLGTKSEIVHQIPLILEFLYGIF